MQRCAQLVAKFSHLSTFDKYCACVAASTLTCAAVNGAVDLYNQPKYCTGFVENVVENTITLSRGLLHGAVFGAALGATLPFWVAISPIVIPVSIASCINNQA
jgi:hypothetical protein